jgi:hypothetical protein
MNPAAALGSLGFGGQQKSGNDDDDDDEDPGLLGRLQMEWAETLENFQSESPLGKVLILAEAPFTVLRKATVPITAEENYSKPWLLASVTLCPLW